MKRCLKCGREFTDAHRFCGSCGGALGDMATPERCPNCSANVRPGWKFCGKCQRPLAAAPAAANAPAAPAANSRDGARCPACQLPVEMDEGEYCEHCGATLLGAADPVVAEHAPEHAEPVKAAPPFAHHANPAVAEAPPPVEEPATDLGADEYARPDDTSAEPEQGETALHVEPVEMQALEEAAATAAAAGRTEVQASPGGSPAPVDERLRLETVEDAEGRAAVDYAPSRREEFGQRGGSGSHARTFEDAPPPHPTRRWAVPGSVALCLLIVGAVAVFKWGGGGAPAAGRAREVAPAMPAGTGGTPAAPNPPPAPEGMVLVPGGSFQMGRDDGDDYERPAHTVAVKPFYIDVHEVTCARYAKFVAEEKYPPPPTWPGGVYDPASAQLPVTGVSWDDAQAYARWAGGRLPTEEEWEFAARGTDGRLYPWGNAWQPDAANAAQTSAGRMVAVGSFRAGAGPFGALDMVGNAWEWTASSLKAYPGGKLTQTPDGDLRVIRGNYWNGKATQATATYRRGYPARNEDYKNTGFRCARDVDAAAR